ncbi:MAG: tetratricopeptide repeat protein, partial [Anaerolineae bacterium]|nr:tetratricopeptide repeat protein [Anaerolineae bacterium]
MAEISLREYLAKLDTLLKSSNAPEVILHCRHILQHFPKEAQTYRTLGRALVDVARWPEAGEVMRRVLSVFPDDRYAHAGLSQVYRAEKRPDDAIWHLERAYEQAPNDQEILDDLRELYRKYRKIEHGKVQLTAGAVARSYIRNGLHEQAVDTLQQALASTPERIDLKLLLAQTYWDAGKRVEAAEIALQVLKVLPDCLVANSLLAALWLTEERPSDAQRYIDRIQSLDPYLALDLAQGQDVPDDAFKLEELDYQRAAEREVLVNAPDWLQGMTHPDANAGIIENPDEIVAAEGLRRAEETPEWSEEDSDSDSHVPGGKSLFGLRGKSEVNPSPTGSLSETGSIRPVPGARRGLTGRLNPPQEQITPEAEDIPSFMADLINTSQEEAPAEVEVDQPAAAELPDWLQASIGADESLDDELPFAAKPPTGSTEEDPLAWLRGSGVEIVEGVPTRPNDSDLFDAEDDHLGLQAADEVDPLAWLRDTGGDTLIVEDELDEEPVESSAPRYFDEEPADDPEGDPLAWLNAPPAEPVPTEGHGLASFDEADEDSLSWLADDSLLDEALNLESLVNNEEPSTPLEVSPTAYEPDWQETMADEKDPLDWLSSSDSEPEEEFTWADEEKSPPQLPSEEDFPDWLGDPNQDAVSDDNIDWMSALPEEPEAAAPSTGNTGMLEWLNKAPVSASEPLDVPATPDFPDWLNELETEARPDTSAEASLGDGGFEWLSAADEVSPGATSSEVPDWLTGSGLTELP